MRCMKQCYENIFNVILVLHKEHAKYFNIHANVLDLG